MAPRARLPQTTASDLLASVADLWSGPSDLDEHRGYRRVIVTRAGRLQLPHFAELLEPFAPVWDAWLSWIEPGGWIVEHVDGGPHRERWQIPLSEAGQLWQDGEPVEHEVGVPFRVHHDRWHSVSNHDDEPRLALVIDRDVIVRAEPAPFRTRNEVT